MQQTLERRRIIAEAEYEAYARDRLRTDLVTEASERLNGAMENEFEYDYQDGELFFQGESLRSVFERGIQNTEMIVHSKPWFLVELIRRRIELKQYEQQLELLQNVDWRDPLVLVHISPTPDAVLSGEVDVNAYDLERKKIMIRVSEPTQNGLKVTSFSLDGGDRVALRAVGDFFGLDIPDIATSEDILDMHFIAEKSQFHNERPAKVLRERYDKALELRYGGSWHAGRRDSEVLGTMQRILRYPELVEQHVDDVARIMQRFGNDFRFTTHYEQATYNFLAAVDQAEKLGMVVGSMTDAGDLARAAGVEYAKSDCPTSQTAADALEQQGIGRQEWVWERGTCQVCLYDKLVGPCLLCKDCTKADDEGRDLNAIHADALKRVAREHMAEAALNRTAGTLPLALPDTYTGEYYSNPLERIRWVRETYGTDAEEMRFTGVGAEYRYIRNRRTGDLIAWLDNKSLKQEA
ncbi:MAG TPA: hypothetical protein PKD68_00475 [Candidatus Saccharibacteria bacterium]|nr:hypothetical protein [Candidatus Saccharibacteria bacterium]